MKAEELMEKLIEILKQPTIHSNPNLMQTEKVKPILSLIKQGMLEVIGEDESETMPFGFKSLDGAYRRNELRAEQRSNLLQMVEGKKI